MKYIGKTGKGAEAAHGYARSSEAQAMTFEVRTTFAL